MGFMLHPNSLLIVNSVFEKIVLSFSGIITDDIPVGQVAEGPLMMNLDLSFIAPTDQTSENIQLAQLSIAECEIHHTTPIDSKMQKAGYMSVSNLVSLGAASSIPDVLDEGNGEGKI